MAAMAAILVGWWAVRSLSAVGDPGWVVVDEFAGQWISLLGVPRANAAGLLAAFLLFRLLDISKPGPIGWIDRNKSALGVMGDDVLAGLLAAAILWAVRVWWPGLLDTRSGGG
jgi:phosphatidylglycerophosphatase A